MMTSRHGDAFYIIGLLKGNAPVTDFLGQMASDSELFVVSFNKMSNKQPSYRSLMWRHYNDIDYNFCGSLYTYK